MSKLTLNEYVPRVRGRYARMTGKRGRSCVLDEFCAVNGSLRLCHRNRRKINPTNP